MPKNYSFNIIWIHLIPLNKISLIHYTLPSRGGNRIPPNNYQVSCNDILSYQCFFFLSSFIRKEINCYKICSAGCIMSETFWWKTMEGNIKGYLVISTITILNIARHKSILMNNGSVERKISSVPNLFYWPMHLLLLNFGSLLFKHQYLIYIIPFLTL